MRTCKSVIVALVAIIFAIQYTCARPLEVQDHHGEPSGKSDTEKDEAEHIIKSYASEGKSDKFGHAFVSSFSVMIVSELGDKTFFIAAIMAMRHPRTLIFAGAISALGLMTVLSAYLGFAVTVIPRIYTHYISVCLFIFFGVKLLREGLAMDPDEGAEELEEVVSELKAKEEEFEMKKNHSLSDVSNGFSFARFQQSDMFRVFIQAFTLTFLAEWGDRSQIATIILGAREDVLGVSLGGVLGHSVCTSIAVAGGRLIAQRISVRSVTIIGGVVFLMFAITSLFMEGM